MSRSSSYGRQSHICRQLFFFLLYRIGRESISLALFSFYLRWIVLVDLLTWVSLLPFPLFVASSSNAKVIQFRWCLHKSKNVMWCVSSSYEDNVQCINTENFHKNAYTQSRFLFWFENPDIEYVCFLSLRIFGICRI